jgi:hypothetical protein
MGCRSGHQNDPPGRIRAWRLFPQARSIVSSGLLLVCFKVENTMPSFDQTPDGPVPFGYKISWFALKGPDPQSVLDALEISEAAPTNWASGIKLVYSREPAEMSEPWVFVSPPIGDWIFAVSAALPYPAAVPYPAAAETYREFGRKFDVLFSRLARRFDDVQFFGSDRTCDFASWARARHGKPMRLFACFDGLVSMNAGEQTPEEAKLGFANLSGLSPADADEEICRIAEEQEKERRRLMASGLSRAEAQNRVRQNSRHPAPREDDVVELAALWSIDPTGLSDQGHPLQLGLAALLPKDLAG